MSGVFLAFSFLDELNWMLLFILLDESTTCRTMNHLLRPLSSRLRPPRAARFGAGDARLRDGGTPPRTRASPSTLASGARTSGAQDEGRRTRPSERGKEATEQRASLGTEQGG